MWSSWGIFWCFGDFLGAVCGWGIRRKAGKQERGGEERTGRGKGERRGKGRKKGREKGEKEALKDGKEVWEKDGRAEQAGRVEDGKRVVCSFLTGVSLSALGACFPVDVRETPSDLQPSE